MNLSWSVTVMRFPKVFRELHEARGIDCVPLGERVSVIAAIERSFPGVDWGEKSLGRWSSDIGEVQFVLGLDDPAGCLHINCKATVEVVSRVVALLKDNEWQGFDSPMGAFLDQSDNPEERLLASLEATRKARERSYDPSDPTQVSAWCEEVVDRGLFERGEIDVARYWDLVDGVDGSESEEVFRSLIASFRCEDDSGQYEATYNALWCFPPERFGPWLVSCLPSMLAHPRTEDHAGAVLCGITSESNVEYLRWFNHALARAPVREREAILAFAVKNEDGGWFEEDAGRIRPVEFASDAL